MASSQARLDKIQAGRLYCEIYYHKDDRVLAQPWVGGPWVSGTVLSAKKNRLGRYSYLVKFDAPLPKTDGPVWKTDRNTKVKSAMIIETKIHLEYIHRIGDPDSVQFTNRDAPQVRRLIFLQKGKHFRIGFEILFFGDFR